MPDPGNVIGAVVTGGAMLTVIGAVVSQTLVPRRVAEQARHDRDAYHAELRLQRQRIEERENQLRRISRSLQILTERNHFASAVQQTSGSDHGWFSARITEAAAPAAPVTGTTVVIDDKTTILWDGEAWALTTKTDHEHDWVEVILPNGEVCNRICTTPGCWAEDTKVKAEHVHQASTRQTPATG